MSTKGKSSRDFLREWTEPAVQDILPSTPPSSSVSPYETQRLAHFQSRYIPPGSSGNHSTRWKFPELPGIIKDIESCAGNVEEFLAMASPDDVPARAVLMYQVLRKFKAPGEAKRLQELQQVIVSGVEAQKMRAQMKALGAMNRMFDAGKPSPALIQGLLKELSQQQSKTGEVDTLSKFLGALESKDEPD